MSKRGGYKNCPICKTPNKEVFLFTTMGYEDCQDCKDKSEPLDAIPIASGIINFRSNLCSDLFDDWWPI